MLMTKFHSLARRFRKDTSGVVASEAAIMFPMLVCCLLLMMVLFDAYRARTTTEKAAYAISDMLSRETAAIDDDYINGIHALLNTMSTNRNNNDLTVTHIYWSPTQNDYVMYWSHGSTDAEIMTENDLANMTDRLPELVDGESLILVHTRATYLPPVLNIFGDGGITMNTYSFTRPRFAPQLAWNGS